MVFHELRADNDKIYAATGHSLVALEGNGEKLEEFHLDGKQAFFSHVYTTEKYVVAVNHETKDILVLDKDLKTVCVRQFMKKPVSLQHKDDKLVLGDKFGDVYTIPLVSQDPLIADGKPLIEPILGHVSMLTDVCFGSHQGSDYIITADRDEHIRVSRYPQAFAIERFLLGHTEFISSIKLIPSTPNLLVSAGGDDFVALWDWTTGELVDKLDLRPIVESYLDETHKSIRDKKSGRLDVTVAALLPYKDQVVVLCEGTKLLVKLAVSDNKLELVTSAEQPAKVISVTGASPLYASLENNTVAVLDDKLNTTTSFNAPPSDYTPPLFTMKQLRKRGEF